MDHRHAAFELGLNLGIAGDGEAQLPELFILLAYGTGAEGGGDQTCDESQTPWLHVRGSLEADLTVANGDSELTPERRMPSVARGRYWKPICASSWSHASAGAAPGSDRAMLCEFGRFC